MAWSREAELTRASIAFQAALVELGIEVSLALLRLFRDSEPSRIISGHSRWRDRAIVEVMGGRDDALELSIAYYRLSRALAIGRTASATAGGERPRLGDLRREFDSELNRIGRRTGTSLGGLYTSPLPDDGLRLQVDVIRELAEPSAVKEAAEDAALASLEDQGVTNLKRRILKAKDAVEASKAVETSAATQAAAGARHAMNGGRGRLYVAGRSDSRVIGWVRLSRTGTPCGFCAMLLSRGFTPASGLYTSEQRAGGPYEGPDRYHDNCQCYAQPVYGMSQLDNDPRFALNREYAELWPVVTKGYSGKGALNAWRRYITKQQKALEVEAA